MSGVGDVATRAMRRELSTVEDNLYRYKHFADPNGTTGNGVPIIDVIEQLERERDELREALRESA